MTDQPNTAARWAALDSAGIIPFVADLLDGIDCDAADYRWHFTQVPPAAILSALPEDQREAASHALADTVWLDAPSSSPIVSLAAADHLDIVEGIARLRAAIDTGRETVPVLLGVRAPHTFGPADPALTPGQPMQEERTYQERVDNWMMATFGEVITMSARERNLRFLEEALELVQATGMSQSDVETLIEYVFGRPKGEINQELGGVSVCLAALATAHGADLGHAAEAELARIWPKSEKIRAKHGTKPEAIRI